MSGTTEDFVEIICRSCGYETSMGCYAYTFDALTRCKKCGFSGKTPYYVFKLKHSNGKLVCQVFDDDTVYDLRAEEYFEGLR